MRLLRRFLFLICLISLFPLRMVNALEYAFPTLQSSYSWYEGCQYFVSYNPENPQGTWNVKLRDQGIHISIHDAEISKLKSTNTKVCKVDVEGTSPYRVLNITVDKPGKATVSFTLSHSGVSKKYSLKVQVRPWENPFKSLKIGSKNYTKYFDNTSRYDVGANIKGKVSIKLKKGYSFKYIQTFDNKGQGMTLLNKYTSAKAKVSAKTKNMETIEIVLRNKKYNSDLYLRLSAIRPVSVTDERTKKLE